MKHPRMLILLTVLVLMLGGSGWRVLAAVESSNADLDMDLLEISALLEEADNDASKWSGGLILTQIQLRQETLKSTRAMLLQKRKSWLRNISLDFRINGSEVLPWNTDQLTSIETEIGTVRLSIKEIEAESSLYRGGLIKNLIDLRAETEKQTLALLKQRRVTGKYAIAPLFGDLTPLTSDETPPSVGTIVEDENAL